VYLNNGQKVSRYVRHIRAPQDFPIFKEIEFSLSDSLFSFQVPNVLIGTGLDFLFGYEIRTPGQYLSQFGNLKLPGRVIELQMDPPMPNGLR
jgi:hypothetical protein